MENSPLLFAKKNNAGNSNLIQQVIKYKFPIPESPPEGLGPPHLYITAPDDYIRRREQKGRDNRDQQGAEGVFFELYIIALSQKNTAMESQQQLYSITNAIENIIKTNKRLLDPTTNSDPYAFSIDVVDIPFVLDTDASNMLARNVVVRPEANVNQRTS